MTVNAFWQSNCGLRYWLTVTIRALSNRLLRVRMAQVAVGALVAVALTGCAGDHQPGDATTPHSPPASSCPSLERIPDDAETRQPTQDPADLASAKRLPPVSFGQPSSTLGRGFDVAFTVFAYKQPAGSACPDPYHPGYEWAAIEVQACANALPTDFEFVVAWAPWLVAFADATIARTATVDFPGFEEPQYPDGKILPVGQCSRGWITLSVPKGKRPVTVLYQPITEIHTWTIPPPS